MIDRLIFGDMSASEGLQGTCKCQLGSEYEGDLLPVFRPLIS